MTLKCNKIKSKSKLGIKIIQNNFIRKLWLSPQSAVKQNPPNLLVSTFPAVIDQSEESIIDLALLNQSAASILDLGYVNQSQDSISNLLLREMLRRFLTNQRALFQEKGFGRK